MDRRAIALPAKEQEQHEIQNRTAYRHHVSIGASKAPDVDDAENKPDEHDDPED
jgi:hypothetical protein